MLPVGHWKTKRTPYKSLRGISQSDWSESSSVWRITKIGSTVLYRHQPTTKELSKDPWSNNKIAKVGLISMISGRKLCAPRLNMNQTVLLVSSKFLCTSSLARCLYRAGGGVFYAATMLGRGAEVVAHGSTTQLHRLFRCLWTRLDNLQLSQGSLRSILYLFQSGCPLENRWSRHFCHCFPCCLL